MYQITVTGESLEELRMGLAGLLCQLTAVQPQQTPASALLQMLSCGPEQANHAEDGTAASPRITANDAYIMACACELETGSAAREGSSLSSIAAAMADQGLAEATSIINAGSIEPPPVPAMPEPPAQHTEQDLLHLIAELQEMGVDKRDTISPIVRAFGVRKINELSTEQMQLCYDQLMAIKEDIEDVPFND